MGKQDKLSGLKENVIIWRLIPARYDNTDEGRAKLGVETLDEMLSLDEIPESPPPPEFEDAHGNIIPVTDIESSEEDIE